MRALDRAGRVDERGREVIGQRGLEAHVGVGGDGQRGDDHHHAQRVLERRAAHPVHQPPPAQHQREQHDRGAERVGDRDRHARPRRRADRDHRGEDRARRRARRRSRAPRRRRGRTRSRRRRAPGPEASEPRERRLQSGRQPGRQQRDAEREQHDHRERPQRAVAEPDAVDHLGEARDRDRERGGQPDDDRQRPPPPAGRARRQQRRQHGQHARRDRGPGAGHEREQHEQRHDLSSGRSERSSDFTPRDSRGTRRCAPTRRAWHGCS